MTLKAEDINLKNFLEKVTYASDSNPGNKLVIADADFLKIAADLKLSIEINRLRSKIK